ncbi:MAG: tetratricopeptide repeat protein [Candidatus Omnitrophota bacterium]|nr:tetratricopeptide repeat protein [Candidatus Omnitrophota bacterium]
MAKTTSGQKILLVILGVVLTIVLLEAGLRLGGFVFSFLQERGNRVNLQGDAIRVLCVGDSMTALGGRNSYPTQLEEILKSSLPGRNLRVINKGLVAKGSADVLARLPENLNRYRPAIVVVMVGINDRGGPVRENAFSGGVVFFLENFRVYHFFQLLGQHVRGKIHGAPSLADSAAQTAEPEKPPRPLKDPRELETYIRQLDETRAEFRESFKRATRPEEKAHFARAAETVKLRQGILLVALGRHYRIRSDFAESDRYFQMAIAHDPRNYSAYVEMGRSLEDQGHCDKAVVFFQKAVEVNANTVLASMGLARCYEAMGQDARAGEIYQALWKAHPERYQVASLVGTWMLKHGRYELAKEALGSAVNQNPSDPSLYDRLAEAHARLGDEDKADEVKKAGQALVRRIENYSDATVGNYNAIAQIVLSRGIKLVCVQYPLRDVDPLRKMLSGKSPIVFVENKANFEEALDGTPYATYFSDMFAGDFGHGTRAGNRLIAENVAGAIVKEVAAAGTVVIPRP